MSDRLDRMTVAERRAMRDMRKAYPVGERIDDGDGFVTRSWAREVARAQPLGDTSTDRQRRRRFDVTIMCLREVQVLLTPDRLQALHDNPDGLPPLLVLRFGHPSIVRCRQDLLPYLSWGAMPRRHLQACLPPDTTYVTHTYRSGANGFLWGRVRVLSALESRRTTGCEPLVFFHLRLDPASNDTAAWAIAPLDEVRRMIEGVTCFVI